MSLHEQYIAPVNILSPESCYYLFMTDSVNHEMFDRYLLRFQYPKFNITVITEHVYLLIIDFDTMFQFIHKPSFNNINFRELMRWFSFIGRFYNGKFVSVDKDRYGITQDHPEDGNTLVECVIEGILGNHILEHKFNILKKDVMS